MEFASQLFDQVVKPRLFASTPHKLEMLHDYLKLLSLNVLSSRILPFSILSPFQLFELSYDAFLFAGCFDSSCYA